MQLYYKNYTIYIWYILFSYHWLIRILLELDQPDARYIFEVQITVLSLEIVASVQIGEKRRWRNSGGFFAINFMSRYVMCLQKRLEQKIKRKKLNTSQTPAGMEQE